MLYPVADTASTIAAYTWVAFANRKEAESVQGETAYDFNGNLVSQPRATEDWSWLRYSGYAAMGLFGVSAIYGFYVQARCDSYRKDRDKNRAAAPTPKAAARPSPPREVLAFNFKMQLADAERACLAKPREWHVEGTVAACEPKNGSNEQALRLDFQQGTMTRITVLHRIAAPQLANSYDDLSSKLQAVFGNPTIDRAPLPQECVASLADCLKNGVKVQGIAWHWPNDSIELQPIWRDSGAILEERYAHEEVPADAPPACPPDVGGCPP